MTQQDMRAVVIARPGGTDGLEISSRSRPVIVDEQQVLVRVRAAGLNRADLLQRRGFYPAPAGFPQDIPGLEFAGEVAAIGAGVTAWRVGQRVFGITAGGAQAEYLVANSDELAAVPDNLSWIEAAAVPEVFITAHDALFTQAGLQTGESVLLHAAGSGVGLAATQLVKAAGATAYGTSRTAGKLDRARAYGLTDGCAVGDDKSVLVQAVKDWTHSVGVNVVLDLVGAGYFAANLEVMAQRGRLMIVGTTSGTRAEIDLSLVMRKRLTITGTVLRGRSAADKADATRRFARAVVPLLADGTLKPVIDCVYDVKEVHAAHERLESNATFGKIILTF